MIAVRASHPPAVSDAVLWICALLAVAVHGALIFAWKFAPNESAAAGIEADNVEITLVESAPGAAVADAQPLGVEPELGRPPEPQPPKKEPEMVLLEPPKPAPPPHTASAAASAP